MESRVLDEQIQRSQRIDAACDHYEHLWRANQSPRIQEFLDSVTPDIRQDLVRELLRVKCELLQQQGRSIDRTKMLASLPDYENVVNEVLDGREQHDSPSAAEIRIPDTHTFDGGTRPSARADADLANDLPKKLGRFELTAKLGRGGNGNVFLARDSSLDREVALKIPHRELVETPKQRARFLREARAAASLHHPNICPVHDVGEIEGWPYIVMRYIKGKSLADHLKEHKIVEQEQAIEIVSTLAAALQRTHELGIVHRDLKPSNVMLDEKGEPVIMDFGLASRRSSDEERITRQGDVFGTPSYMSPEQAQGDVENLGPLSDVYSLGAILYELLTGEPPFSGSTARILVGILQDEPDRIENLRDDATPALCEICRRSMSKNPSARFASMADFAQALSDVDDRTGDASTLTSSVGRRYKSIGTFVAGALLFLGVMSAVFYFVTNSGTLEIRTSDENVKIEVSRQGNLVDVIDTATGTELSLRSGRYDLKLVGDRNDVKLSSDRVVMDRGGRTIVEVVFVKQKREEPAGATQQRIGDGPQVDGDKTTGPQADSAAAAALALVRRSSFSDDVKAALTNEIASRKDRSDWVTESGDKIAAIAAIRRPNNEIAKQATSILAEAVSMRAIAVLVSSESLSKTFSDSGLTDREAVKEAALLASGRLQFAGNVRGFEQQAGREGEYVVGLIVAPTDQMTVAVQDKPNQAEIRSAYSQVISSRAKKLMEAENWDEALALWLHLHQTKLTSKLLYLEAARCFHHMGKTGDAIQLIDEALKTVGNRADARLLAEMGDLAAEIDTEESRAIAVRAFEAASQSLENSITP